MGSNAKLFLSLNLLLYVLSAAATCGTCSNPSSLSPTPPTNGSSSTERCPIDILRLGVCANLLGGLVGVVIGNPPIAPCCTLLDGLLDLEATVCLCTAIRANVLGINLSVDVALKLVLNECGKTRPTGFIC